VLSTLPETEMNIETIKLTYSDLTIQESDLIFMGLKKLPMDVVEALVMKLGKQAALQIAQFKADNLPDKDYFQEENGSDKS
jgi:hypothetical protein